ncbi:MAG: TIGR00366 family protein [Sporolactobacillus sp.]|jgi:short-chain fatty acids transporter|nr:TIGR00366 family protein [Sporolactobacillus sp.]
MVISQKKVATCGLPVLGKIVSYANVALDPKIMGYGPVPATRLALKKADLDIGAIDLFEINEAFAVQSIAVLDDLGIDPGRILSLFIGLVGMVYTGRYFFLGVQINLNIVNFMILFLGILLLGTPAQYVASLNRGIKTIAGILLQFPFYAGIMAIMIGSGLVATIASGFVGLSSADSLPFWGLISSFIINFFVPSGGGHWVVQGPFMIDAAKQLQASLSQTSMSVMLGCAWNDIIQPFWLLPALALAKLRLKDLMGYLVLPMMWVGIVYITVVLIWGFFF